MGEKWKENKWLKSWLIGKTIRIKSSFEVDVNFLTFINHLLKLIAGEKIGEERREFLFIQNRVVQTNDVRRC